MDKFGGGNINKQTTTQVDATFNSFQNEIEALTTLVAQLEAQNNAFLIRLETISTLLENLTSLKI
jgi:prefoldin subunit 5